MLITAWNRVLIESDWNLKSLKSDALFVEPTVLIESDWNLKLTESATALGVLAVLIESDWNLKDIFVIDVLTAFAGINRIRLEFKGHVNC